MESNEHASPHKSVITTPSNKSCHQSLGQDSSVKLDFRPLSIDEECDNAQTPAVLTKGCMSECLGTELKDEFFCADLPTHAQFKLSESDYNQLVSNQSNTTTFARRNSWQHIMCAGIAESNKFCVFTFQRGLRFSSATIRNRKSSCPILQTKTYKCAFKDCRVKASLKAFTERLVNVYYSGILKHDITEKHARPICGTERKQKMNTLHTVNASKHYMSALLNKSSEELVAGNFNGIGCTKSVLRKIRSESNQQDRQDRDVLLSMLKLKQQMKGDIPGKKCKVDGFIQNIGLSPFYAHFYSKRSLQIWHELAARDVVFLDATGGVARPLQDQPNFLYYELSFANPLCKESAVPVAAMLSADQRATRIRDFLAHFRDDEKRLYGHNRCNTPVQVNVDASMAMIVAVLDVFCNETVKAFLERSWMVVAGSISEEVIQRLSFVYA